MTEWTNGVFTLPDTKNMTQAETETDGIGFYNNVWKCFHCSYSETNVNLTLGSVHILLALV